MSYYVLPRMNNNIFFHLELQSHPIISHPIISHPIISHTLIYYLTGIYKEIQSVCEESELDKYKIMVNTYEYISSKVPGTKFPISKLRPKSKLFYHYVEIIKAFFIFEFEGIKTIHYGKSFSPFIECMNCANTNDKNNTNAGLYFENINNINNVNRENSTIDLLSYEMDETCYADPNSYILSLLEILLNICFFQKNTGSCIIKIDEITCKPVIDVIHVLCSFYEKVFIIKPNTTNIVSSEKYIVCKNFVLQESESKSKSKSWHVESLTKMIETIKQKNIQSDVFSICSLINNELGVYFLNKLEEFNIVIGNRQIEALNQIYYIIKNNSEDKIELLKKNNIKKCFNWCIKYDIPYNKHHDKTNIFLPSENDENDIMTFDDDY